MTERVDFYVLSGSAPQQRLAFACRLTEKAYLKNMSVLIVSEDAAEARAVDELLWTFNDRAFVPHEVCAAAGAGAPGADVPVRIAVDAPGVATPGVATPGVATPAGTNADLLVNLSGRLPAALERFTRIAEIIDADPERRRLGRERFKAYREQKLPLETHQLNDGGEI
jgi:DNA polymerase-3 subunit chi